MENEEELQKELNDLSPGFPERKFSTPPDSYFDQLPDRIINRWKAKESMGNSRMLPLRKMIAAAAILTGLCLGIMWWTNKSVMVAAQSQISSADAYQYILENIDEFGPLIQQQGPYVENGKLDFPDTTAIEEYLIDEMSGEDLETIF